MCHRTAGNSDWQLDYQLAGTVAAKSTLVTRVVTIVMICACVFVFSHVWLFVTPWTVAHQAPLLMGFRVLEWVAISSSRGSSQPRDRTHITDIQYWEPAVGRHWIGAVHDLVHFIFIITGDKTRKSQCWRKHGLILNPICFVVVVLFLLYSVFSTVSTALVTHDSAS